MTRIKSSCRLRIGLLTATLFLGIQLTNNSSQIVLLAAGDTMMASWAEAVMSDSGYAYPFENLQPIIADSDIFLTNLEAPFGRTGVPFDKKYVFRVKPELVNVLLAGRVNLVSLGNNHIMDYGPDCLQETINILQKNQIKYAGAGANLTEARKAAIIKVKNKKVAFLSYSLTFPKEFWATDTSAGTCFPYDWFAFKDIKKLKAENDLVIIACHWGQELQTTPKEYQVKFAHLLIESGADLVLGHHPHAVQGIEIYKGKLIAYSLGNFIFGSYSESVKDSFLIKLCFQFDDGKINAEIVPINVYNKDVEFRPALLQGEKKQEFIDRMTQLSRELNADSIGITSDGKLKIIKS